MLRPPTIPRRKPAIGRQIAPRLEESDYGGRIEVRRRPQTFANVRRKGLWVDCG